MQGWLWLESKVGWHYFDGSVSLCGGQPLLDNTNRPDLDSPICRGCLWALVARGRERQHAQSPPRVYSGPAREGRGLVRRAT